MLWRHGEMLFDGKAYSYFYNSLVYCLLQKSLIFGVFAVRSPATGQYARILEVFVIIFGAF